MSYTLVSWVPVGQHEATEATECFLINVFITILTVYYFCNGQFLTECNVKDLNAFSMNLVLFIQAGDRSLADVVAHEISHSWTGNLVTNRNFEHFWLNEGFTVFVERKILAKMYGEKARHFSAIGGLKDLKDTVSTMNFIVKFVT